jgi:hypothetical protein
MSLFDSNASSIRSRGGFSPNFEFIRMGVPPQFSMRSASLPPNSPLTGIMILSSFLTRLTTDASTAPVPEAGFYQLRLCIDFESRHFYD